MSKDADNRTSAEETAREVDHARPHCGGGHVHAVWRSVRDYIIATSTVGTPTSVVGSPTSGVLISGSSRLTLQDPLPPLYKNGGGVCILHIDPVGEQPASRET
jgi:hypothetical protein